MNADIKKMLLFFILAEINPYFKMKANLDADVLVYKFIIKNDLNCH